MAKGIFPSAKEDVSRFLRSEKQLFPIVLVDNGKVKEVKTITLRKLGPGSTDLSYSALLSAGFMSYKNEIPVVVAVSKSHAQSIIHALPKGQYQIIIAKPSASYSIQPSNQEAWSELKEFFIGK